MELTNRQLEIIKTNKKNVVVMASAASGKTACLTARFLYLVNEGAKPEDIVLITFTNLAAGEIRDRLGDRANGAFIGTIHSLAYRWLVQAGYDLSFYTENDEFDKFFPLIEKNPEVVRPVKHLLVDEFQDCNEEQIHFMIDMIKPETWMIFGDHRQSMYRFNGARPDLMINLSRKRGVEVFDMDENFRNGRNILQFAKKIISVLGYEYADLSIATRDEPGAIVQMPDYTSEKISNYIKKRLNDGEEEPKDWFVLTRNNQERDILYDRLMNDGIPSETFKKSEFTSSELKKKMDENTVKVLTIHQAKGLENKCVAVVGAKYYNEEERCIAYVAATRAKDLLVWCKAPQKKKKKFTYNWE